MLYMENLLESRSSGSSNGKGDGLLYANSLETHTAEFWTSAKFSDEAEHGSKAIWLEILSRVLSKDQICHEKPCE